MVVPMPAGAMGAPMSGPLPDTFRKRIKGSVTVMIISLVAKLISGSFLFGPFVILSSSLNLILNTIIGIFLMSDDTHLGKLHRSLMRTCFSSCEQQCQGQNGMNCLMPFVLCNFITVIMDVIFGNTFTLITSGIPVVMKPESWPNLFFGIFFTLFVLGTATALLAQVCAMYFGWKAYKEVAGIDGGLGGGLGGAGGSYAPPSYRPAGPAPGSQPSAQQQGMRPGGGMASRPQQQSFQPFGGAGHTLGSK